MTLDPDKAEVRGTVTHTIAPLEPRLTTLRLDCGPRLEVEKVAVDGSDCRFEHHDKYLNAKERNANGTLCHRNSLSGLLEENRIAPLVLGNAQAKRPADERLNAPLNRVPSRARAARGVADAASMH